MPSSTRLDPREVRREGRTRQAEGQPEGRSPQAVRRNGAVESLPRAAQGAGDQKSSSSATRASRGTARTGCARPSGIKTSLVGRALMREFGNGDLIKPLSGGRARS